MTTPLTAADLEREAEVLAAIIRADTAELPPNLSRVLSLREHAFTNLDYKQIAGAVWMVRYEGQDPINGVTLGRLLHGDVVISLFNIINRVDNALPEYMAEQEAEELLKGLPTEILAKAKMPTKPRDEWAEKLAARAFDFKNRPADLFPVYSLMTHPVCTAGNLTSINAGVKSGKSAVVGAMIAAAMADEFEENDLLGFSSSNPNGLALVHFDTEQSPYDYWQCLARAIKRAGATEPPDWLCSYHLTGFMAHDAWQAVQTGIRLAAAKFGGIHSVLIDGVGDLIRDVNDAAECNGMVASLHGLAIQYACPIIGVLHFNPGTAKSRGHLGSQLERKAESNLQLLKEEDGCTVLWSDKQRRQSIPKGFGPRFRWSDEHQMHISVESLTEAKRDAKAELEIPARDDVFMDRKAMRYNELVEAIQKTLKVAPRTAERRANKWQKLGIISKTFANLWEPTALDGTTVKGL